jgi:hypothetical protein
MALQWFVFPSAGAIGAGHQPQPGGCGERNASKTGRLSDKSEHLGRLSDIQDISRGTRLLALWAQFANGWPGEKIPEPGDRFGVCFAPVMVESETLPKSI